MIEYEFQCPKCQGGFTALRDPHKPKKADCPVCGVAADRVFSPAAYRIDWVNGPDGINMGTGQHHKSAREREYWAESHGLQKVRDG